MGVERVHFHSIDNIQSRCSGKKVTGAFDGIAFKVCFVNADFHSLRSFFVRRYSQSCGLYGPVWYRIPPAGFGSTHKNGSKNNCDFAGFDLNGDLHNKSSHAPVKTAIIIQLYFKTTACISCKLCYLFIGPGFPGPWFCFTVLPVCRASMPCSPAGA